MQFVFCDVCVCVVQFVFGVCGVVCFWSVWCTVAEYVSRAMVKTPQIKPSIPSTRALYNPYVIPF